MEQLRPAKLLGEWLDAEEVRLKKCGKRKEGLFEGRQDRTGGRVKRERCFERGEECDCRIPTRRERAGIRNTPRWSGQEHGSNPWTGATKNAGVRLCRGARRTHRTRKSANSLSRFLTRPTPPARKREQRGRQKPALRREVVDLVPRPRSIHARATRGLVKLARGRRQAEKASAMKLSLELARSGPEDECPATGELISRRRGRLLPGKVRRDRRARRRRTNSRRANSRRTDHPDDGTVCILMKRTTNEIESSCSDSLLVVLSRWQRLVEEFVESRLMTRRSRNWRNDDDSEGEPVRDDLVER